MPFSHQTSRGRTGNRLPLLPHIGGGIVFCRIAADGNVHDLPFADMDERSDAGAGRARAFETTSRFEWVRVNALPEFVYFDHSIHVAKGIGCTTCHGPVGEMPLTWAREHIEDVLVPGLPSAPGEVCAAEGRGFQHFLSAARESDAARQETGEGIQNQSSLTDCATCHR